jgi:hypothetical protein
MSMNFKFSRSYGVSPAVQAVAMCCSSNTHSADVLQQQHRVTVRSMERHADDTGGLSCFLL